MEVLTPRLQARQVWVRALGRGVAALAALLLAGGAAKAQGVTGPALRAAFLFNFPKFASLAG